MTPWTIVTVLATLLVSMIYAIILDVLDRHGYWQGPPFTIVQVVIGFGITVGIPSLAVACGAVSTPLGVIALVWACLFAGGAAIGLWYAIGYQRKLIDVHRMER